MSNLKYKHTAYTSAQWASLNPVIVENEIVIESDTKRTKIGNGISTYNELEYADANSVGNSLGSIKPTDAAPTPARNGNYTFSVGGDKPAWLTAEAGVTEVKAGDGVAVVYTAPSSYGYTHIDIKGNEEAFDILKNTYNQRLTSKTAYAGTISANTLLNANGTTGAMNGYQTTDYITADNEYTTKYIESEYNDTINNQYASACYYDANNALVLALRLAGLRTIAVRSPYKVKVCTVSGKAINLGTAVESIQTALVNDESKISDIQSRMELGWLDTANSTGLTNAAWVTAYPAILGLELIVNSAKVTNVFQINTFCTVPTALSESTYGWKFELRDATDNVFWKVGLDSNNIKTGIQLLTGTSADGLRTARIIVNWDKLPNPFELYSGVSICLKPNVNSWKVENEYITKENKENIALHLLPKAGKKMVWIGTSIPAQGAGTNSYPELIAAKLGMTCYNEAIGGSAVRAGGNNTGTTKYGLFKGLHSSVLLQSLAHTIAEKQQLMDYWQSGLDSDGNISVGGTYGYRDFQVDYVADYTTIGSVSTILGWSYENKIIKKYLDSTSPSFIAKPDYFVFDHGHNDLVQPSYDVDEASAIAVPALRNDRTTFIGAMNYVIDEMLKYDARLRIIFVGHYENARKPRIWQAQQNLFDYWDFPSLKLWEKMGWSQQTVQTTGYWSEDVWYPSGGSVQTLTITQIWMQDDLHPSTLESRALIANILAPFISNAY